MDKRLKVKELYRTCCACPAQWEGETINGRPIYIRYRYGFFAFSVGKKMGDNLLDYRTIYSYQHGDGFDGDMDDITMLVICMKFCDFSYVEKLVKT
ncbi:unnamed protein product [marine sediment metagenome]|uniref:Uncharacterized protein n=1 Tax=marine sediment metagenome TaxID=412755 RepID=X0T6E2_9ZZZZ